MTPPIKTKRDAQRSLDLLELVVTQETMRRFIEQGKLAGEFCRRTGLHPSQCIFVEFKGKTFVQWKGATAALPVMGVIE